MIHLRRALGALLLASQFLPIYLLLADPSTGLAGASTVDIGRSFASFALWGTLIIAAPAFLLARTPLTDRLRVTLTGVGDLVRRPTPAAWAIGLGVLSCALAALASVLVFSRLPTLLDEMTQLMQARYFASGSLTGALPDPAATRLLQNDLMTSSGWASVYPPLHTAMLGLGFIVGAPWLVGPVLLGVTALFTALSAERLMGGGGQVAADVQPSTLTAARLGSLLVALSPFLVIIGSGYLSHTSAGAFAAVALYAALRARDGGAGWAVLAGAAAGAMVASRPWTGLVLGGFFTIGIWGGPLRRKGAGWTLTRFALAGLGGLPFAAGLAAYNTRLFGSPLRLGYDAAFGPAHGLGWHVDPWGNAYGAKEALGYTGFDLLALGQHLLETPVPALALVALLLLLARRLPQGTGILLGWALLPVAANALYWHHGYHLGPRMLYESAPAWALLVGIAAVELTSERDGSEPTTAFAGLPAFVLWLCVLAVPAGLLLQLPPRVAGYRWDEMSLALSTPPEVPDGQRALVFVHGSWQGRSAAQLVSMGMRRDSVETLIRRNDACAVELYEEARGAGGSGAAMPASSPPVTFELLPGTPGALQLLTVTPGSIVRKDPAFDWVQLCRREAGADRLGVVELAPLLWQTPLPEDDGPLILVRDLGPSVDQALLARFPGRDGYFYMSRRPDLPPELVPFEEGLRLLWAGG